MHSCNMDSVLYIHSISAPCYNKTLNCTLLFHSTNCTTVRSTYLTWLPRCQIRTQCNSKQPSRPPANPLQFQGSCKPFKSIFKSKQSHAHFCIQISETASNFQNCIQNVIFYINKLHPKFQSASKNFDLHPKCPKHPNSI